jgi:hypothetical protein
MTTKSDLRGKFFYDVFTTAKEWATGLFYFVFPSKRPKPETVDDLTVEKKLWQKPTLLRKPPTVFGDLAAMSGIGEWKDNRGNTLSGQALQCDGETSPRHLAVNDATILHNASTKVHMNGRITGNIHAQDWQELNHLSPLEVGCNAGMGDTAKKTP